MKWSRESIENSAVGPGVRKRLDVAIVLFRDNVASGLEWALWETPRANLAL